MANRQASRTLPRKDGAADRSYRAALLARQKGDLREASRLLQTTLEQDPAHFGALCNLAMLFQEVGGPADGLALAQRAVEQHPHSPEAQYLRADLLRVLGRAEEATLGYEKAIALNPDFVEAYVNLGGLHSDQGRHEEARRLYERALAIRPDFAAVHNNLAVVLLALDLPDESLAHSARALAIDPGFAEAQGNRGSALIALGRIPEAAEAFEAAIRLSPRTGRFYLDLAGCRTLAADDPILTSMQALARDAHGLPAEDRIALHFALGKALAGIGEAERSFGHYRQGNALKRVHTAYDETQTLAMMERLASVFTRERLLAGSAAADGSAVPVFVVGMPRSGTTLIEQILASHPAVFGAGERRELHHAALRAAGGGDPAALFDRLAALPDERVRAMGAEYVQSITELAPHAARIVDKMPGNFLYVGLIALALPSARIVHVCRDPIDTCLSCYCTLFSGDQPYAYNLGELGRYYRAYARLTRHWREAVRSGQLLEVRYEDVVDRLEPEARRIVAHCGLEWDEACLRFHQTPRTVQTASKVQVRRPLYRSSIGRWKAYGDRLAPLIQALGSEREPNA